MKLGKLSVLTAAALLAGGMGMASAQSSMSPSKTPSAASGKCWDSATRQVKDMSMNKNQTASGAKKPGGVTTGAAPSGSAAESTGSASSRPAAAAGLPNC
jgi:hypothetical protein